MCSEWLNFSCSSAEAASFLNITAGKSNIRKKQVINPSHSKLNKVKQTQLCYSISPRNDQHLLLNQLNYLNFLLLWLFEFIKHEHSKRVNLKILRKSVHIV